MQEITESRFGAETEAEEVVAGQDLSGKLAIVTGGAAGIGKETARVLSGAGADVVIGGRNQQVLDEARKDMAATEGQVTSEYLDLMSADSVEAFAASILAMDRPVDMLICNAGVMGCPLARTEQGIESQLGINYVGHALLVSRLLPALLKSDDARVVVVSSSAHQWSDIDLDDLNYERQEYEPWEAYGRSKTANVLLAVHVAEQLGPRGVTAHALHPGGIATGLLKHAPANIGEFFEKKFNADLSNAKVKTVQQGASTTVWAATEPSLKGQPARFLEDCSIAAELDLPTYTSGVMRYALDPQRAAALWSGAERLVGRKMPLTSS